jgi:hypothetical protein
METAADSEMRAEDIPAVTVRNLPGTILATVRPVPETVLLLKQEIENTTKMPRALQKLIKFGEAEVYSDTDKLVQEPLDVILIKDETPMFTWDIANNPGKDDLEGDKGVIKCPRMEHDYCNVLTKEPMRSGVHFFQFVMHYIGDEQSCGIVADNRQVGYRHGLRDLKAWAYYPGRVRGDVAGTSGDIRDGKGALHAKGRAVKEFKSLRRTGDVIGMLVDLEQGAVAFDLNGELQGACAIPTDKPLYVITHLDTEDDHVELLKPSLDDAPPANLEALKSSLIDVTKGVQLGYFDSDEEMSDDDNSE